MMKNEPIIGKLIPDSEENARDAIHVAVISAICPLTHAMPGEYVQLVDIKDGAAIVRIDDQKEFDPVGIVDPFLANGVLPGNRFWLFLLPKTVTSLRHNWEHPKFAEIEIKKWEQNRVRI